MEAHSCITHLLLKGLPMSERLKLLIYGLQYGLQEAKTISRRTIRCFSNLVSQFGDYLATVQILQSCRGRV